MITPAGYPTEYEELDSMKFSEFLRGKDDLCGVSNIHDFEYNASTTLAGRWSKVIDADRVAIRVQASILESLRLAEFHNPGDLDVLLLPGGIRFEYSDPDYGFVWSIDDDGAIKLRRPGSSLKRFHEWYRKFMPSVSSVLREIVAALDDEIARTSGRRNNLAIHDVSYTFRIICFGFAPVPNQKTPLGEVPVVTNLDLMKRLLNRLPDADGRLADTGDVRREEYGRLDYQASRWVKTGETNANEVYRVEAPSNNAWSSLWFTFLFGGSTRYAEDGTRQPFDSDSFVAPSLNDEAYLHFFRDRAVQNFLSSVTSGFTFNTTPSQLP